MSDATSPIEFLSSADAARILNITPAAVRLAALQNRIPVAAVTPGGVRLFARRDIEQLARERAARRTNTSKRGDAA